MVRYRPASRRLARILVSFPVFAGFWFGVLIQLAPVATAARAQVDRVPLDGDYEVPVCPPTGYSVYLEWSRSDERQAGSGELTFPEIPRKILFSTYLDLIRRTGAFAAVSPDSKDPHDFRLIFHIERLEREAVSSSNDLALDLALYLTEVRFGQTLWSGRFRVVVESQELGYEYEIRPLHYTRMAKLAAIKLATATANELKRFLTTGGIAELQYAGSPDCTERTSIRLQLDELPLRAESILLQALSDSPCYALISGEEDGSPLEGAGQGLLVRVTADSIAIREVIDDEDLFQISWSGDDETRVASARRLLEAITNYHHRNGVCQHYLRTRAPR